MKNKIIKLYEFIENQIIKQNINSYDGEKLLTKIDKLYFDFINGLDENQVNQNLKNIIKKYNLLKN